jgi:hypothetical protein
LFIEQGDAGTGLEDLEILSVDQMWDIVLQVAVALARAEKRVFEVRRPFFIPLQWNLIGRDEGITGWSCLNTKMGLDHGLYLRRTDRQHVQECLDVSPQRKSVALPDEHTSQTTTPTAPASQYPVVTNVLCHHEKTD